MADKACGFGDIVCGINKGIGDVVGGAAGDALNALGDAVTAAVVQAIASLGSVWTTINSASLTTPTSTATAEPGRGTFNAQVDLILQYAAWIGLAVAVLGVIFLGITLVVNARRGDGQGLVNSATLVAGGAVLIGGATSIVGFLVPGRATNVTSSVGFLQDQTMYLTLAIAALSVIIGGVQMAWTQRAEPVKQLLKGLLTLGVVTAAGVTLMNVLVQATDALAKQVIDAAIGTDFKTDVMKLLAMDNALKPNGDVSWLGGNVMLIIVGGLIALVVTIVQIALMALRTGMLVLMAGILPLSAAFLNTEMGRNFFQKVVGWTLAFIFYKPAAALIYATAIKLSTTGLFSSGVNDALLKFAAGLMLILASVFALPVLIGFLSPVLGAMSGAAGGSAMGVAAMAAIAPQGAAHLARSGRGFGATNTSGGPPRGSSPSSRPGPRDGGAAPSGGGTPAGAPKSTAATGGAAKAAGPAAVGVAAAGAVMEAGQKATQAVSDATSTAAGDPGTDGSAGGQGSRGASAPGVGGHSAGAAAPGGAQLGHSAGGVAAAPGGAQRGPAAATPSRARPPQRNPNTAESSAETWEGPDGADRS